MFLKFFFSHPDKNKNLFSACMCEYMFIGCVVDALSVFFLLFLFCHIYRMMGIILLHKPCWLINRLNELHCIFCQALWLFTNHAQNAYKLIFTFNIKKATVAPTIILWLTPFICIKESDFSISHSSENMNNRILAFFFSSSHLL